MKNSAITSFFTAAALSFIAVGSSLAAAEENQLPAADPGVAAQSGHYAQFGMTLPRDLDKLDRAFMEQIKDAVELQGVQVSTRAQSMAEARYQQYNSVDTLLAMPSGDAYQSVAIAR